MTKKQKQAKAGATELKEADLDQARGGIVRPCPALGKTHNKTETSSSLYEEVSAKPVR